jgi:hypothetical protein
MVCGNQSDVASYMSHAKFVSSCQRLSRCYISRGTALLPIMYGARADRLKGANVVDVVVRSGIF